MKSVHVHGVRTGAGGLGLVLQPHDLKLVSDGKLPGLDASRDHGPATGDAKSVLHRHQKGLLQVASGGWDGVLHRLHELLDGFATNLGILVLGGGQGAAGNDLNVVTWELIEAQQLAHCVSC